MYCYIFEYSTGLIHKIEVKVDDEQLEGEELLIKYGYKPEDCAWMFTDFDYDITIK